MTTPESRSRTYIAALLVSCVFLAWNLYGLQQENTRLRHAAEAPSAQTNLGDGIVVSSEKTGNGSSVASAAKGAGMDAGVVSKDAASKGAQLTGSNTTVFGTGGTARTGLPSSESTKAPPITPATPASTPSPSTGCESFPEKPCPFQGTVERFDLNENYAGLVKSVPFGFVQFQASNASGPWSETIYPRTFTVATALTTKEDGSHDVYSHVRLEVNGEKYSLPIREATWTETLPEAKFRWSSKLYLGPSVGIAILPKLSTSSGASLQFSLASYGKTSRIPSFSFGLLGAGYDFSRNEPVFSVTPAMWNAGDALPWIDSLYIGPSAFLGPSGSVSIVATVAAKL